MDRTNANGRRSADQIPLLSAEDPRNSLQRSLNRFSAASVRSGASSTRTRSSGSSIFSRFSLRSRGTLASTNTSIDFDDYDFSEQAWRSQQFDEESKRLIDELGRAIHHDSEDDSSSRSETGILKSTLAHIDDLQTRNAHLRGNNEQLYSEKRELQKHHDQLVKIYNLQVQGCRDAASAHNARVRSWNALKEENAMLRDKLENSHSDLLASRGSEISNPKSIAGTTPEVAISEVTEKLSSAGVLDLEAITTESCQETIASVMDAFKDMMGLESSSSETDSEYESSLADSLSSRSSEGHNEVHDNVDDVDQEPPRDGDGESSPGSGSRQSQTSASAKRGGLATDSRKRIRTNSPTDDDADGNQKRQKPGTPIEQDTKEPKKKFACPYHKRWPQVQPAHRACVFPGFSTVHRMKEHLFRRHALGIQCRICYESFDDDAGLTQHLSLLNQCPGSGEPSRVGFTIATERKLRERMRGSEEEKWMKIYKTLFEDDEEALNNIPSPYWEYSTGTQDWLSSGYDTSEAFERIQRENVIEIVQDRVIELSRRQQVISTERLLSALPDIFRTAQEEVRNRYPRPHQNPAREVQAANSTILLENSSSHENDPVADRSSGTSTEMLEVPETFEIPADVSPDHLPVNLNTETLQQRLRVPTISESQSADSGYGSMELASSAAYTSADSAHCPLDERNRGGDVGSNDNQPNPSINSGFQAQDDSFATLFLDISDIFPEPSISQETYPHSNDLTHAPLLDSRWPTESSFPSSQPTTGSEQNSDLVQDADNLQADDLSHWLDMDPLLTAGFNVSNTENTFIQAPRTTALSYSSDTHLGSHSLEPAISRSLQSLPNAPASSIPETRPTNRSTPLHASSRQGQPSTPHPSTHPTIQLLQPSTAPRNFYLQAPEAFYLPTENGGTDLWQDSTGSSGSSSNRSHLSPFGNPALGGSSGNRYDDMLKRLRGPPPGSAS